MLSVVFIQDKSSFVACKGDNSITSLLAKPRLCAKYLTCRVLDQIDPKTSYADEKLLPTVGKF
jgi:hypothetical protein